MATSYKLGFHKRSSCELTKCGETEDDSHTWDGCKCLKCGRIRDEGHDWSKDCEVCARCGKTRENAHQWDGNECSKCGRTAIAEPQQLLDVPAKPGMPELTLWLHSLADSYGIKDIKTRNEFVRLSLITAAKEIHKEDARALLAESADADTSGHTGITPLLVEAFMSNADIIKELLSTGEDPDMTGNDENMPLVSEAYEGLENAVKALLSTGEDPDMTGNDENTPSAVAKWKRHIEIVLDYWNQRNRGHEG